VNYTLVGAFVLVMGAALIGILLWLASGGALRKNLDSYMAIEVESVAGLELNAPVKYNGVNVGKVRKILLDPTNPEHVNLTMSIEHSTPIREDTVAVLKTQGLTGIAFVELSGSTLDSPVLRATPGYEYPVIHTRPSLSARLENVLTTVLSSLDSTSKHINAILSDQNQENFKNTLADLASIAHTVAQKNDAIARSLHNADVTMANGAQLSAEARVTLDKIGKSADAIRVMGTSVTKSSELTGKAVNTLGSTVQGFSDVSLPEVERLIGELDALSASMRRVSEQTERSPNSLLFGIKPVPNGPGEQSPQVRKP
jgi:phospholipid/cholesterol/gamma-HCH transport system substrate-binding protein